MAKIYIPRMLVQYIDHAGDQLAVVARENNDGNPVTYVYIALRTFPEDELIHWKDYKRVFGAYDAPLKGTRKNAWKQACKHAEEIAQMLESPVKG